MRFGVFLEQKNVGKKTVFGNFYLQTAKNLVMWSEICKASRETAILQRKMGNEGKNR